ncbi:hypothetical protein AZE42_11240 [Rhizopogon vesiculosus]|uniref:Uncharacterized protein n=1 Tax=Rhizopogon vesiculosus TaxID=180088 RepID=A0A1J8QEF0_9AGAM|nr:hypothetical protein AZE42_11240 [Rhizopogon vesiculosus]
MARHNAAFHAATYMDNNIVGIPQALQKSSHPAKVSHVDFSACTVITGNPNLELDEVGVSEHCHEPDLS